MIDTSGTNKIPEWQWERVHPIKDGIITIIFNKKYTDKLRCRELNYKVREFYKNRYE